MFLFRTNFRNDILILLLISIILGTVLVLIGGYITNNYFANVVSGVIGEYGEYDLLFMITSDKEDIAIKEIERVIEETLPGSEFKKGPTFAGSSNYLLKLPKEYKNEQTYTNLGKYFADIPGLTSKTIMTEPRLSVRGFRGSTRTVLRPLIEEIEGIDFLYSTGDGLDIIVTKPELVPDVKKEINDVLKRYKLLEIRYPLNQHPEDLPQLEKKIYNLVKEEVTNVNDVTKNTESRNVSLLISLKQMKTFLLSYATKIIVSDVINSQGITIGSKLVSDNGLIWEVIEKKEDSLTALFQEGALEGMTEKTFEVYLQGEDGSRGRSLGRGKINNPRQDLAHALDNLNEITPSLEGFLELSEQLAEYSARISTDLTNINQGLDQVEMTSQKLTGSLLEWQQKGLSSFLGELLLILDNIKANIGDINDIQSDLIISSNRLKEAARVLEEKLIYVPRNNSLYQQLAELKDLFLQLAIGLDQNYDLVVERLTGVDNILSSIDEWKEKINSLLKVEDTLSSGADWQQVGEIISELDKTLQIIDTSQLQDKLTVIQDLLTELKTTQLPLVLDQLEYIQQSLPKLEEEEIVDTLKLIDSYIAGQVIPGDQIQLLLEGQYNNKRILKKVKDIIRNPTVSFIEMDAGVLQPNPRGEVFNILIQVRAVISTIIAFVFTLLIMILDQVQIISVINLNNGRGYLYGFFSGAFIFSLICLASRINFPYLDFKTEFIIGGVLGLIISFLAVMLNPVNREEWEAGKALGLSPAEIMQEIIIPAGKPGLLYLLNYPKVIFK